MKKILYFIAALSLVSAVSCVKEEAPVTPSNESMTVTLGFDGGNDPDRKAAISDSWGLTWDPNGTEKIEWDGGSYNLKKGDINPDNTVTFTAAGLTEGTVIYFNRTPVYGSYEQGTPGSTNWGKLYLKGTVAPEEEVTKMKIVGSMLRFIPYTTEYSTESVKSVTFESGATSYTVTITNPVTLEGADSKENAKGKSIYLPIAATTYNGFTVVVRTVSGAKFTFTTAAPLVLDENTIENLPLPLKAAYEQGTYSVTFNTDGGTAVSSQTVKGGDLVVKPEGVTKDFAGSLSEGLYPGVQDPDNVSYTLEGWYTDAEKTQKYDFSTPVTGSLTLYAKWVAPEAIDISAQSGNVILTKAYSYFKKLKISEMTKYTLLLASDQTFSGWDAAVFNNSNVTLKIVGAKQERKIIRTDNWQVADVQSGVVIFGNNVTVTHQSSTTREILNVNGTGKIIMSKGSKISGVNSTAQCVVKLSGGTCSFILDGGDIVGNNINAANVAATVYMPWGCTFNMTAGSISNNIVTNTSDKVTVGGVYGPESYTTITKTGGVISGNTAKIELEGGATPTATVVQQVLYKTTSYNDNLSESDNI